MLYGLCQVESDEGRHRTSLQASFHDENSLFDFSLEYGTCRDSIISIRSSDPSVLFVKQQLEQESPPEHIQNLALSMCRDEDPFSWKRVIHYG